MKITVGVLALSILGTGAAFAQEGRGEDFRRDFERRMRELEERFKNEREKLEKEFREHRERLMPRRPEGPRAEGRPRLEDLVEKLIQRVESLEKRLEGRFGGWEEFGKRLPRDFDFKRFGEFMPPFKDREFRFEFRRKGGEEKGDREKDEKDRAEDERERAKEKAEKKREDGQKKPEKKKVEKEEEEKKKSKDKDGF